MSAGRIALAVFGIAAPAVLFSLLLLRVRVAADARRRHVSSALGTIAFGALLFVPAWFAERRLEAWVGLDESAKAATDIISLLYAFAVAAPLEQGLKVAAIAPAWRARRIATPTDGVLFASAAALGFVSAHNAMLLVTGAAAPIDVARALLAVPAHLFFAAAWGYALGRRAMRMAKAPTSTTARLGDRVFNLMWLAATLFNGVFDHIVFARAPAALIATAPILLSMAVVTYVVAHDRRHGDAVRGDAARAEVDPSTRPRRFLSSAGPPSVRAVRAALWRTERPVTLRWIGFGALVTTGVITSALACAVALGHRLGVDFTAVDRGDVSATAGATPLILLGAAALGAFPIAGYLVARASATRTVLEPAVSAAAAIAGSLILLGLAAPIAVVFAMAFAPVAFGLACAGAWMGRTR